MRTRHITAQAKARPEPAPAAHQNVIFRVFQNEHGRWCVASDDGMTGGIFFDRAAAIHFARRESASFPVLESPRRARS